MISSNFVGESLDRLFGQALLLLILSSVIHCEIFACSLKKVFFCESDWKSFFDVLAHRCFSFLLCLARLDYFEFASALHRDLPNRS